MTRTIFHGKVVTQVFLNSKVYKCKFKTPSSSKLFNFGFSAGDRSFIVLDGCGDDHLPEEVVDRLLGPGAYKHGYALAICVETGEVYTACFAVDKKVWFLSLSEIQSAKVPKRYLSRLPELMSKKRPFSLGLSDDGWRDLWDQEIGFQDLYEHLTVSLSFDKRGLQLWGDTFREVSYWSSK